MNQHRHSDPEPPRPIDPNAPDDGPIDEVEASDEEQPVDPEDAVDHRREHGVPPAANDDYDDDMVDFEGAESFPASDPPAGW